MGTWGSGIVRHNTGEAARRLDKAALAQALRESRQRTLRLFGACEAALGPALTVPCLPELNPPLWELGHVGWFADWWLARNPQRDRGPLADPEAQRTPARQAVRGVDAEALYHSSLVPHDRRWHLPLPDATATQDDLAASLDDTLALLAQAAEDDDGLYFFRLALAHEDMHAEAAFYMAQSLGFDAGEPDDAPVPLTSARPAACLDVPAGVLHLGHTGPGFAFDNELGAHPVTVQPFAIDAGPVTWARYLPFIASDGYSQPRWWTADGWAWRQASGASAPRYLRQHRDGRWEQQRWGRWRDLDPQAPACHLTMFEAQAWCAWAGRRLPTEAEWVAASVLAGFDWGGVWEWTASTFAPFPGFEPHPYRDYSQPWFDGRPVLKGASPATHARLRHPQYRNFFPPGRNDIFAGFRSVAA